MEDVVDFLLASRTQISRETQGIELGDRVVSGVKGGPKAPFIGQVPVLSGNQL